MKGYVVRKGNQYYAVIYEGLDPITGREHRRWHQRAPIASVPMHSPIASPTTGCVTVRRAAPASTSASPDPAMAPGQPGPAAAFHLGRL